MNREKKKKIVYNGPAPSLGTYAPRCTSFLRSLVAEVMQSFPDQVHVIPDVDSPDINLTTYHVREPYCCTCEESAWVRVAVDLPLQIRRRNKYSRVQEEPKHKWNNHGDANCKGEWESQRARG